MVGLEEEGSEEVAYAAEVALEVRLDLDWTERIYPEEERGEEHLSGLTSTSWVR